MLRKPGSPDTTFPKLISHSPLKHDGKLLTSIVADEISHLTEKHQLLPSMHFGGRLGNTTTGLSSSLVDMEKATGGAMKWCQSCFGC